VGGGGGRQGRSLQGLTGIGAILRVVLVDMKASLAVKKMVKEARATVKVMQMGDTRVKEASAQCLLKEFENIVAMDSESIEDLVICVTGLANNLHELGEKMEGMRIVRKLMCIIPKRYNQIACSIEMLSDLNTMSVEELIGKLRTAEDCVTMEDATEASAGVGRLLLTEEQWEARQCSGKEHVRSFEARRANYGSGEKGGGHNGGHGEDDDDTSSTSSGISRHGKSRYHGCCFNLGGQGHMGKGLPCEEEGEGAPSRCG
jgi:hypothetical protein